MFWCGELTPGVCPSNLDTPCTCKEDKLRSATGCVGAVEEEDVVMCVKDICPTLEALLFTGIQGHGLNKIRLKLSPHGQFLCQDTNSGH